MGHILQNFASVIKNSNLTGRIEFLLLLNVISVEWRHVRRIELYQIKVL